MFPKIGKVGQVQPTAFMEQLEQLYSQGWNWCVSHCHHDKYECRIWKPRLDGKIEIKRWSNCKSLDDAIRLSLEYMGINK